MAEQIGASDSALEQIAATSSFPNTLSSSTTASFSTSPSLLTTSPTPSLNLSFSRFTLSLTSGSSSLPSPSNLLAASSSTGTSPSWVPIPATENSKNGHLPPLVGGLVGGSVLLVLVSILAFLKCRRRRTGWALDRARHGRIIWPGPEIFRHRTNIQDLLPNPISPISNHIPPESKRERLERTRLELEEAQRLRDAVQLDLDNRSSPNGVDKNSPDGVPDTAEFVAMRAQIQQMSMMIAALQAEARQQAVGDSQPPAYSTTIGP